MSDDLNMRQAEKLIGGWVARTLTDAERSLLLEASLSNQTLFDALADEEGLRELLADPQVRRELAAVFAAHASVPGSHDREDVEPWWRRLFKPVPLAAFSAGVLAVVALVAVRPELLKRQSPAVAVVTESTAANQTPAKDEAAPPPPAAAAPSPRPLAASEPEPLRVAKERRAAPADVVFDARKDAESGVVRNKPAGVLADKNESIATDRLAKAAEPAPQPVVVAVAVAPPPPPRPVSPPRLEAPKTEVSAVSSASSVAVAPVEEAKLKRADVATGAPIRYRVERLQPPGGQWVEFGGELGRGSQARLAIDATQVGVLTIRLGAGVSIVGIRPGETVHYPATGSLPAESGERKVAIVFRPGAVLGAVGGGGATASPAQVQRLYGAKAAPPPAPAQQQQQQIPGGGVRQREQQQAAMEDTAVSSNRVVAGEYAVTVRVRYR